jgi:hypothetical protein
LKSQDEPAVAIFLLGPHQPHHVDLYTPARDPFMRTSRRGGYPLILMEGRRSR